MRGHRTLILPGLLAAAGFTVLAAPTAAPWSRLGSNSLDTVRHLGGVVGWLALAWLGSRLFDLALRRAMASTREAVQYPRLLSDLVRVLLFGLALLAILIYVFEGAAVGFFATSSVLIAVVGFALRNIISDVFSGIALNFERPYRLGDWIEVAPGTVGRVTDIDWRATRLVTRDGVTVIVPNGLLAGGRLINYSYPQPAFRISLRIALDANVPVAHFPISDLTSFCRNSARLGRSMSSASGFPTLARKTRVATRWLPACWPACIEPACLRPIPSKMY
jgi:small-conductance mechanosensitive channel